MPLPLIPLLIVVGIAAFVFDKKSSSSSPAPGKGNKPGEENISADEAALLERLPDGSLRYLDPQGVHLGAFALQSKSFGAPTGTPGLYLLVQHDDLKLVPPSFVDATQVANAYEGAKELHSRGFDIWLTPTIFQKDSPLRRDLYAAPAGLKPPANTLLALYRAADEPWIEEFPQPPAMNAGA